MKEIIILSKKHGKLKCLVDDADYVYLSKHNWFVSKDKKTFYAVAWIKDENNKFVKIKMHQMIMGEYDRKIFVIDHISRDALDNRRCNLRFVTWAQNAQNRRYVPNRSGYKGVCVTFYKGKATYAVSISYNNTKIYQGGFKTAKEAAMRYNELARQYHGEFAYQNPI